jgi:TonB family protein
MSMTAAFFTIDDLSFKRFFKWSIIFHIALTALILFSIWFQRSGENWGGIGGGGDSGVKVNLVTSTGIPMMQPTNTNPESEAVDPTKGLHKEEPKPKPPEPKTDAAKIPKFEKEKPLPPSKKSKVFERKTPDAENAVPYGKSGTMNIPSGYQNTPGPLSGGVAATGEGGGDFAGRYPWYVQAMRRAVGQYWNQNQMTIDPSVRTARRARTTLTFTINRDGTVRSIKVAESSGNRSMDDAAQRSLLSVDHFSPLPPDYSGNYINVSLDFGFDLPL